MLSQKRGDDMKVGFIGAGRAGCSLGRYFADKADGMQVAGYYSLVEEEAIWAAAQTGSVCYKTPEEVLAAVDSLIISTSDGAVKGVWESISKENLEGRIICHLSGSLSSDVFSGIEAYGAYPLSIHPMFAFSSRESDLQQLQEVCFTLEGAPQAVSAWQRVFGLMGNPVEVIRKECKPSYHAAASLLSNHVIAVLSEGYALLKECGFTEESARQFTATLVRENVERVIEKGCVEALTGPIERGDFETVQKHLRALNASATEIHSECKKDNYPASGEEIHPGNGEEIHPAFGKEIYHACGKELLRLAQQKNPERDYSRMRKLLYV